MTKKKNNEKMVRLLIVMLSLSLIITAVCAVLLYFNPDDKKDLGLSSGSTANSLSDTSESTPGFLFSSITTELLKSLKSHVDIYLLYDLEAVKSDSKTKILADALQEYDKNEQITLNCFDPDKNPKLLEALNVDGNLILNQGDIVIKSGVYTRKISGTEMFEYANDGSCSFLGENYISAAIKLVSEGNVPIICFLKGHGEKKLYENCSSFNAVLTSSGYSVRELDLSKEDIPKNTKIVLSAAPTSDITDKEKEKLDAYISRGGNISFLLSPNDKKTEFTNISNVIKSFGLGINYDKVYETEKTRIKGGDKYTFSAQLCDSSMKKALEGYTYDVVVSGARSVFVYDGTEPGIKIEKLMLAFDKAKVQTFGGNGTSVQKDEKPICLACSSTDSSRNNAKLILFGSAGFIDDSSMKGNVTIMPLYLLTNSVGWMYNPVLDLKIEPLKAS